VGLIWDPCDSQNVLSVRVYRDRSLREALGSCCQKICRLYPAFNNNNTTPRFHDRWRCLCCFLASHSLTWPPLSTHLCEDLHRSLIGEHDASRWLSLEQSQMLPQRLIAYQPSQYVQYSSALLGSLFCFDYGRNYAS
jgi:hypothetical protein